MPEATIVANRTTVIKIVSSRIPGWRLAPPDCSRCRQAAHVSRMSVIPKTDQATADAATPNQSRPGVTRSGRFVISLAMHGKVGNQIQNEDDKYPNKINEVPLERDHLVRPKGWGRRAIPRKKRNVGENHQSDDDVRGVKSRQRVKN